MTAHTSQVTNMIAHGLTTGWQARKYRSSHAPVYRASQLAPTARPTHDIDPHRSSLSALRGTDSRGTVACHQQVKNLSASTCRPCTDVSRSASPTDCPVPQSLRLGPTSLLAPNPSSSHGCPSALVKPREMVGEICLDHLHRARACTAPRSDRTATLGSA